MPFTARASLFKVAARDTNNCKRQIHHFPVEWCYLHPQLAGELGLIYCKSGVRLLEMPLTKGDPEASKAILQQLEPKIYSNTSSITNRRKKHHERLDTREMQLGHSWQTGREQLYIRERAARAVTGGGTILGDAV